MPKLVRVFHLCAGDCGACAAEVWAAVEGSTELTWAVTPQSADVVALTGSIPAPSRNIVLTLYALIEQLHLPLIVVGRCAIDGHPFGKGGIAAIPEIEARRKVDGSPPLTELVAEALLNAARTTPIISE
jgi:Ni,Fe-hydrogenase III small subunit